MECGGEHLPRAGPRGKGASDARDVAEIPGTIPDGTPDPLHLDLTWTSTGIISRSHSTTHSSSSNSSTKTITHSSTVAGALPGGLDVVDDLEFTSLSFHTSRTVFTSH